MENLVEKRIETTDRWGNPAVEVRYVYQEPDINEYMADRGGKAYSDGAYDKLALIQAAFIVAYVVLVLIPIDFIVSLFKKNP